MLPIEYRIENEDESVTLDFKKEVYGRGKNGEFLKDVAAFANALSNEKHRYIVIGVKEQNGTKEYFNIDRNDVGDVSNYQQLIDQNIEPNIPINIKYVNIEEKELAVFEIGPCDNPPYVFKKDYQNNKQGIIYIRNGTSTRFIKRQELDLMYQSRQKVQRSDILVGFNEFFEFSTNLRVLDSEEIKNSPSNKRKREIEHEIKYRKSPLYPVATKMLRDFNTSFSLRGLGSEIPLALVDDSDLEKMLLDVENDYMDNDNYYYFEEIGNHFNLFILNQGAEPLKGCTIKLKVPIKDGLRIAQDVYAEPTDVSLIIGRQNYGLSNYPDVEETDTMYIITEKLKTIKHKLPKRVFLEDVRIIFPPSLIDTLLTIQYEIFSDNYPDVISGDLQIKVVKNH